MSLPIPLDDAAWLADLKDMRHFARPCPDRHFGQQPAAQIRQLKASDDRPTIGLLLCRTKKRLVAEDALSGIDKPMGVAEYQRVRALPEPLDTSLPSIETLEAELSASLEEDEP